MEVTVAEQNHILQMFVNIFLHYFVNNFTNNFSFMLDTLPVPAIHSSMGPVLCALVYAS